VVCVLTYRRTVAHWLPCCMAHCVVGQTAERFSNRGAEVHVQTYYADCNYLYLLRCLSRIQIAGFSIAAACSSMYYLVKLYVIVPGGGGGGWILNVPEACINIVFSLYVLLRI